MRRVTSAEKIPLLKRWSLVLDCGHRIVRNTANGGKPRSKVEICHVCPDLVDPFPGVAPRGSA